MTITIGIQPPCPGPTPRAPRRARDRALRLAHLLALTLAALISGLAVTGCGDNLECVGDQCLVAEDCSLIGDEDGDGTADCDDTDCSAALECQGQLCPNGVQNIGEGCDDGNMVDTDACTNTCQRARCGDGIIQAGTETCDDGNTVNTDACTNTCQAARCGDSIVGPGEQCDDGNMVNNDGCSNTCTTLRCGDGIVGGTEQCDDGNMVNTDACTNACTTARCGDTIVGPNEQCDDGNMANNDACTNTCQNARCGDAIIGPGEMCDDGNMVNNDLCTNMCTVPTCGDGIQQGIEQCDDGNMVNTDGCLNTCLIATCGDGVTRAGVEQCDDMNLLNTDACTNTCQTARCGDTFIQVGVETCDDGNLVNTDTCTNACMLARCGDGFVQGLEACDDGNMINGDGCDNTCVVSRCGNGVVGGTEQCDDANLVNGDGCDNNCTLTACGNGIRTGLEACDDGNILPNDGCSATCTLECGNGMINGTEQCDDGNTTPVDGCGATCTTEPNEVEPNEDGTPSTGGGSTTGNDFDVGGMLAVNNATLNGLVLASGGNTARLSKITPTGDEDVYAIKNDTLAGVDVRIDTWNRAVGFGAGVPCGSSIDLALTVRNAAGVIRAANDDRNGAIDRCPGTSFGLAPNATLYVQVLKFGDSGLIDSPGYGLQAQFSPVVCGDNRVSPLLEECDDANVVNGDGCSNQCVVEGTNETEPNEDGTPSVGGVGIAGTDFDGAGGVAVMNATAQGVFNVANGKRNWIAALTPAGDEDVFALTNGGAQAIEVTVDTWDAQAGVGQPCNTVITDTGINIRDAAGVVLFSNDNRATGDGCSRVTFVMSAGQTRYLHVTEQGDNAVVTRYIAAVSGVPVTCGNNVQTLGIEECDDGNLINGDGCSNMCVVEGTSETEPNDDGVPASGASGIAGNDFDAAGGIAVMNANTQGVANLAAGNRTWRASITPIGDEDVFAVTNMGAVAITVQADTWDLTLGLNRPCPTATTDTGINVKDAAGVLTTSNDDRVSGSDACSRVSFGLLPGQTRYLQVVEYADNAVITKYALVVTATAIVCGNGGAPGFGEECDDGNVVNGDGCSATCQLETAVNEVEPNTTSADADAAPAGLQIAGDKLIRGSIGPLTTDVDRYKVTVAAQTVIRFETFGPIPGNCDTQTTVLRLFDSAGVAIGTAADSTSNGINACSAIVMPLAAGTYYIQVEESGLNALIAKYFLEVDFQTDKGMELEAVNTSGLNDTFATASANLLASNNTYVFGDHTLGTDIDVYSITVPAGGRIRAELVEGNRGTVLPAETCESFGIDSVIELRDQLGAVLGSDDDDGRGFCSMIDGTGTTPLDAFARNATAVPQTYYLGVKASVPAGGAAAVFEYRLQVTIR